jgi:hypothetical protein
MSFKGKLKSYALGFGVLAVAVPIYMQVKHRLAEPAGTKCESSTKCRGNGMFSTGMCLQTGDDAYCTHTCDAASDCTTGMACEAVEGEWTTESGGGNHATRRVTTQGTKMVCVKAQ